MDVIRRLVPEASERLFLIQETLGIHNVHYKQLPTSLLAQTPSHRLTSGAFVFPGSKFHFNHTIYLSETRGRTLLAVAYSKSTIRAVIGKETEQLLLSILNANAMEIVVLWKLEERKDSVFPVLEMALFPPYTKELIWAACGTLDDRFKATVSSIAPVLNSTEVAKVVQTFLHNKGFRKVKEASIPAGVSYLVVMLDDQKPEESQWKRFPLKIDITDILAFRIYFSLNDAAVTAQGHFRNAAKTLIAELNPKLQVGYFNYSSSSNQIQLTLKLHHHSLTPADLALSVGAYFDTCVLQYQWTVRALAVLHQDMQRADHSLSQVSDYADLVSEEVQEFQWTRLEGEVLLLQELAASELPYLLPRPFYRSRAGKVSVKTSPQLLPFSHYVEKYPLIAGKLLRLLLELYTHLVPVEVFPTMDMVFCMHNCSMPLRIVPGVGLHRDKSRFLGELVAFGLAQLSNLNDFSPAGDITELNWSYFETPRPCEVDGMMRADLGGQRCLLYPLKEEPNVSFSTDYSLYTSLLGQIQTYPNPLLGWTKGPRHYLCERYDSELTPCTVPVLSKAARQLQQLHTAGYCHWFLSPVTIRVDGVLVLPCLSPRFSSLVCSVLPECCLAYLAPEVKRYLKEDLPVTDGFAADVYSLCQLFASASLSRALRAVVDRGKCEDWRFRPTLDEVMKELPTT